MSPDERQKLLHAIVFFVENTRSCQKIKLFKLLFFLDFKVYRETGKSVTGLGYFAWQFGPVPRALFEEFERPSPDLEKVVLLRWLPQDDPESSGKGLLIRARAKFDEMLFTKRELRVMKELAEIYRDANASQMIEVTHLAGKPWHQVYEVEGRKQAPIPYRLALDSKPDSLTKEQVEVAEEEAREAAALFG